MKIKILILIFVLILSAGCTIKTGGYFEYDKVKTVEIGMTKQQVICLFGMPFMTVHSKGYECWVYNYTENHYYILYVGHPNQINLGVVFDQNDKVYSFEYNKNYDRVERVKMGEFYEKKN